MDEMCNKAKVEDLNKTTADAGVVDNVKRCASPVFKCVSNTKAIRGNNLDSSDYDIPSYQINQSVKSRTSSKYGSETSESVLPFSPVFSPIPIPSMQFQPPSIHSLGTVAKTLHKSFKSKVNSFLHNNTTSAKPCGLFESLGMTDKDISWVSSMASPPPKQVPGSEFNTIEKATFLPEEKFQNIQPRALFSPNLDDDFGCHPISFCSESENDDADDEAYKSNVRLSDVCATLRQLEVKSLDQASDHSAENAILEEGSLLSPVIRTKRNKPESVKKKKKSVLVMSPNNQHMYEFSVGQNENIKCDKVKSDVGSNFMEEDSFQSMSFSGIDELCRTLVTEGSTSSALSKLGDCDKSPVTTNTSNSKTNFPKMFYESKAAADVYEVSSVNDLHSYAKALEEGNTCINVNTKISKTFVEKGIVRFDVLNKDSGRTDATKRLHSEVSEETDVDNEKKLKKLDDESTGWEKMKPYLSESQLNVSDGEIFRTVENLEKTLASQDSKDLEKLGLQQEAKGSLGQNLSVSTSRRTNSETAKEMDAMASDFGEDGPETCTVENGDTKDSSLNLQEVPLVGFTNVLGSKISVSRKALDKAREILRDCSEKVEGKERTLGSDELIPRISETANVSTSERGTLEETSAEPAEQARSRCLGPKAWEEPMMMAGFFTGSGKQIQVSAKALEKAKALMSECDKVSEKEVKKGAPGGFSTGSGKKIQVSAKALEKARALMRECDESWKEKPERQCTGFFEGFSTGSGKLIQVSAKALEKAKALMRECDEGSEEAAIGGSFMESFPTGPGEEMEVITRGSSEKVKTLWTDFGESSKVANHSTLKCFSTGSGKTSMLNCEHESTGSSSERASGRREDIISQTLDSCERAKSDAETAEVKSKKARAFVGRKHQESAVLGFSTASGNKVKITRKALEKARSLWCESEESVTEMAVNVTEPSLTDFSGRGVLKTSEETLEKPNGGKKGQIEREDTDSVKTSVKNESEASKLEETDISGIDVIDDWGEIIPTWLHVYSTRPSVASDRIELSPVMVHEDGKSSRPTREYVVRSPVLGSGDRFHGKRRRRKLRFGEEKECEQKSQAGFVVPYTDSYRKGGEKRASALSIDFSVPFKRVKFVEEAVVGANSDVRVERARKREEQEKAVREKQKVKPSKGLHLSRKCSEKQTSLMEAVGGSSPEIHSDEVLKNMGVREEVLRVSIRNAGSFTFNGEDYFGPSCKGNIEGILVGDGCVVILDDGNRFGVEELKRGFLASSGVQPSLVPDGWIENHYKWIVWKLAHYERSFPGYFAGRCLTPDNVMLQLRYRYDREIDGNERSALKKILERDDTSAKRLVLCVCGIEKTGVSDAARYELSLTDGWYSCPARADPAMTRLLDEGKLCVGTKLMTQGAVLVNCEQGISPLEITGEVHLKISTNSTRRVKWDTKLGFQRNPKNFPISLGSILAQGGPISRIDVIVVRIYPVLYMEKTSDGHYVTRNRRSEEKADAEYRRIQEQKMEAICSEFRTEMRKSADLEKKFSANCFKNVEQAEDMYELMENTEPSALQRQFLENFQWNQSERMSRELLEKIEKKLESENLLKRNVSEFFRAKIVDFRKPDYNNPAVISVWHPSEDLLSLLTEGKVISLMNVAISNSSSRTCKPVQINTTRQTQYVPISRSVKYPARKLTQLKDVSSKVCPAFEEVDVVGMVVLVQDVTYGSRPSQVVYLSDLNGNFVGIVFWGSCKNYGWENMLRTRCIVACSNLQWKRNYTPQDVPSLYVTENSVFTENPKQSYMKEEMGKLKQSVPPQDVSAFLSKCEEDLLTRLKESSKRRANSNRNSSTNEPTPRGCQPPKCRANGFESKPTASSTPIKPFTARITSDEAEPSPIQKRIEKLQAYGEPPPLIPLVIRNKKFTTKTSVPRTCQ